MPMADYPEIMDELIAGLKTLPGIGRRSAERLALAMLKWPSDKLAHIGSLIQKLPESVTFCPVCGNLAAEGAICAVCADAGRRTSQICVVEDFSQIITIENSGSYRGLYHVLGGRLSPLENRSVADLAIEPLLRRLEAGAVKELILALSPDVEGRATAIYLAGLCEKLVEQITRPAQGLPAGADITYADSATISAALAGRVKL